MDRQIIALLKPQLERDFGWSEIDYSNIVAVFQFAYAVGSVLMGIFIDKIGVRCGMAIVAFFGAWRQRRMLLYANLTFLE